MRSKSLILILFLLFVFSCDLPKPKYGVEWNEQRKKYGLPLLDSTWKVVGVSEKHTSYENPKSDSLKKLLIPHHAYKRVNYDKNFNIWSEKDEYYGDSAVSNPEGYFVNRVIISYIFKDTLGYKKGWYCTVGNYNEIKTPFGTFKDDLTLEQAEAILKLWGLTRLNYKK
jgi:hypothetical protein